MMQIHKLYPKNFGANTFFVTADGVHAIVIDPAQPRALDEANRLGLKPEYVLLTHGHFDHIGGCAALQAAGAKIGCLKKEEALARFHNLGLEFTGEEIPPFAIDFTMEDGEKADFCGIRIEVLATPGHTAGSACYLFKEQTKVLFTGDTLFQGSVGRTDLPTGSAKDLRESLKKLCALPFEGPIYTGHGEDSTLLYEKTYNDYLKC